MRSFRPQLLPICAVTVFCGAISAAHGDVTFTPRVSVEEEYTDNIALASKGSEDSEFITRLEPGLQLQVEGNRVQAKVDYQLQQLIYRDDRRDSKSVNNLDASMSAELIDDLLFMEASHNLAQQNTSLRGTGSDDDANLTGDRRQVATTEITPIVRHRLGNVADVETEISYRSFEPENSSSTDTSSLSVAITAGEYFGRFKPGLSYSYSDTKTGNNPGTILSKATLSLAYRISAQWEPFVKYGRDMNDFQTVRNRIDGPFWELGVRTAPTPRTHAELAYGDRYAGPYWRMSANHRMNRLLLGARYSDTTTTSSALISDRFEIPTLREFYTSQGFSAQDLVDLVNSTPATDADLDASRFVNAIDIVDQAVDNRSFNASIAYQSVRQSASLNLFQSKTEPQITGDNAETYSLSANFRHRMTRQTSLNLSGEYRTTEFARDLRQDDTWNMTVGMNHRLGRSVNAVMSLQRRERQSTSAADEYVENSLSAKLSMTF